MQNEEQSPILLEVEALKNKNSSLQDVVSSKNKIIELFTAQFKKSGIFIVIKADDKILYPTDIDTLRKIESILKNKKSFISDLDDLKHTTEIHDKKDDEFYKVEISEFIDDGITYQIEFIENISREKYFEKESKYDKATDVYNRKTIENKIDECIINKNSLLDSFSLVICDVDNFKIFNDSYGHSIGDIILIRVAEIFKKYIGDKGFVGRYGGDEFILVLKNTDEEESLKILNRIIFEIGTIKINHNDESIKPISISCGIYTAKKLNSYFFESSEDVINLRKKFFDKADIALYESKENGKGRASIYEEGIAKIKQWICEMHPLE